MAEKETRCIIDAELRVEDGDDGARIIGHAAVFNRMASEELGFRERVAPGAFTKLLDTKPEVRALFNHDPNCVLGNTKSGTLRLSEDSTGLLMDTMPPDTQAGRDVVTSIRRGDITGQSFSFLANDEWSMEGGVETRTITEVYKLYDVGPVTFPAYPDTSVALRSLDAFRESQKPQDTTHTTTKMRMRCEIAART